LRSARDSFPPLAHTDDFFSARPYFFPSLRHVSDCISFGHHLLIFINSRTKTNAGCSGNQQQTFYYHPLSSPMQRVCAILAVRALFTVKNRRKKRTALTIKRVPLKSVASALSPHAENKF
jgi:hypothetical protein